MLKRKILVGIMIAAVISLSIIPTAFATYYGWWNNSLAFSTSHVTKGNYLLPTSQGGFLGDFVSDCSNSVDSQGVHHYPTFNARLEWYQNGLWYPYGTFSGIHSNGYTCKVWSPINGGFSHHYIFWADKFTDATHSNYPQTVTSQDAGYFYNQ